MSIKKYFSGGEALLVLATLVAGIGWVASKEVIQHMPAPLFLGLRFLLAGLVLLPWCYHDIRVLSRKTLLQALTLGVLLSLAIQVWIYALSISDSMGEGAFIMSTAVLFAPLLGWLLFRVRPQRAFWLALPIAVLGVALLSLTDGWTVAVAQIFFISSAILISLHFNLNKHFSGKIRTLPLVCLQIVSAGCFSLLLSLFLTPQDFQMTPIAWGWFAVSIVLSTSLRYVLQTLGQSRLSNDSAAVLMILEPVWVLLLGMSIYQETLSLQKALGCSLIVLALVGYQRLKRRG